MKPTPPNSNIDTKNDGLEKLYLLSNMAVLGTYVSFQGCGVSKYVNMVTATKYVTKQKKQKALENLLPKQICRKERYQSANGFIQMARVEMFLKFNIPMMTL